MTFAVLFIGSATIPFQTINAQNMTITMDNATSAGNATTGENATTAENATTEDQISSTVIENLARPGFASMYEMRANGDTVPLNYNLMGGRLVGILADPSRNSLDLAVDPSADGGAMEINLPRNVIDSKFSDGKDRDYTVIIDGDRVSGEASGICIGTCPNIFNSFKESQNTGTDRVLTIVFGPESRFIEIVGNRGI
ncbi:MAG: hypothetical protein WA461_07725 [Nitrososphaeraceae archaeon]